MEILNCCPYEYKRSHRRLQFRLALAHKSRFEKLAKRKITLPFPTKLTSEDSLKLKKRISGWRLKTPASFKELQSRDFHCGNYCLFQRARRAPVTQCGQILTRSLFTNQAALGERFLICSKSPSRNTTTPTAPQSSLP